jgi:hypothetical protein
MLQADLMDDLILETANACTPATAQADKVKIAAFQWRASKLMPKSTATRQKWRSLARKVARCRARA